MARTVRQVAFDSRTARARLKKQAKPYWRPIERGLHLGYRRGERGGTWCVRRFLNGRYQEGSLGIADDVLDADGTKILSVYQAQSRARAWFAEQQAADARRARGEAEPDQAFTVNDAMDDYIQDYRTRGKALRTVEGVSRTHIRPSLGDIPVRSLTARRLREWFQALSAKPARLRGGAKQSSIRLAGDDPDALRRRRATANRIRTVLVAALNYAWREGRVDSDAAWRRTRPNRSVDAPVVRYLTDGEARRLVNAADPVFSPLIRAALLTGARWGELIRLQVGDFNPDAGTVVIRESKAGKPRHVVLAEEGRNFFADTCAGREASTLMFTRASGDAWAFAHQIRYMRRASEAAGIKPAASFHVLRHSHASRLAMAAVPMGVIAHQLGHADTRMTEKHYAHLAPSYVADTIRAAFGPIGIETSSNVIPIENGTS